jgi:hypothetical protein
LHSHIEIVRWFSFITNMLLLSVIVSVCEHEMQLVSDVISFLQLVVLVGEQPYIQELIAYHILVYFTH